MTCKLVIRAESQTADLLKNGTLLKTYKISTAKNGAGCTEGSYCTPAGKLRVAEKIGHGLEEGAVLKSRLHTGDVWKGEKSEEDMILSRILWLEGMEEENKNAKDRYIYIHGTNQEHDLGKPASKGCVRFSNKDMIEVFDFLSEGAEVEIIYPPSQKPKIEFKP